MLFTNHYAAENICLGHDTDFSVEDEATNVPKDTFSYESIGVIRTSFESAEGMPIQPIGADSVTGTVEIEASYADGLADLAEFSHCMLLYHFHASSDEAPLRIEPFLDDEQRGVFSTRAPQRPNPIGLSVVAIESVTEQELTVSGIDVVDGTPLLDIKPFVPEFDIPSEVETGWLDASESTIRSEQADKRFL
nr:MULTISPECIES: tRNA (N6-threonylcarbamoyladenosine(37)-N6)-methyltransferase TrmO [Halorubrum]